MEFLLLKLDIYTLMVMALCGHGLGFLILALTWLAHRDIPGTKLWLLGSLLAIAGQTGFVMQIFAPFWPVLWMANILLMAHVALLQAGLCLFFGHPVPWRYWSAGMLTFAVVMGLAFVAGLGVEARILISNSALIALCGLMIRQIMLYGWRDYRLSAVVMVTLLVLLIVLTLCRFLLLSIEEVEFAFGDNLSNVLPYVAMLIGGTMSAIALLLLCTSHRALALRRLATQDPLTGVLNRRGIHHRLGTWNDACPLMLAMLDLDDFKQVNDRYGHEVGDRVLQAVGAYLNAQPDLVVGRFGGEEFVLLARKNEQEADRLCQCLCNELSNLFCAGIRVTASLGVGVLQPGQPLEQSLQKVDEALYQAKRAGKNRVRRVASLRAVPGP